MDLLVEPIPAVPCSTVVADWCTIVDLDGLALGQTQAKLKSEWDE